MTREEAIEVIEQDIPCEHDKDLIEALEMAISALKEEPAPFDFELFLAGLMDIPKGMTNGEVIKALFPDSYFLNVFPFEGSSMEKIYIDNKKDNKTHIMAQEDWWNAPYQKGGK